MELSFCSLASGSSGNCYLIKSRESAVLIDAGISTKRIHSSLEELGMKRGMVGGVFVTHEHTDHVKGLKVLTKQNPGWNIYASAGTARCIRDSICGEERLVSFRAGDALYVGGMKVKSFSISHDAADPVGYSVTCGNSKITIITDTGCIPDDAAEELREADLIVMEANHEVQMLKAGPYPYNLKMRILGDKGHLSNDTAGDALAGIMAEDTGDRFRKIMLAHLSEHNNFPKLAFQTVKNLLEERSFTEGRHFSLDVMSRDRISGISEV